MIYSDPPENPYPLETQLGIINAGLQQYYQINKLYPTTDQGLKILLNDKFYEKNPELVDSWGRELIYRFPGICGNFSYDLYSTGKNLIDECAKGDDRK